MAIYHFHRRNISRKNGSNACASLAYITGLKVEDNRTGQVFDYSRKERVVETGTILPDEKCPAEWDDPAQLFNAVEKYKTNANARTAVMVEMALPRELPLDIQSSIVSHWINQNVANKGFAATYAIHNDAEGNNPHAHILIANQKIQNGKFISSKVKKEYVLDENGNRVPVIDKSTGKQKVDSHNRKQWKRKTVNVEVINDLDGKQWLSDARKSWADINNEYLAKEASISEKSYQSQGINKVPTVHEGFAAREMQARGVANEKVEYNKSVREQNWIIEQAQKLRELIRALALQLKQIQIRKQEADLKRQAEELRQREEELARREEAARQAVMKPREPQFTSPQAAKHWQECLGLQEDARLLDRVANDVAVEGYEHLDLIVARYNSKMSAGAAPAGNGMDYILIQYPHQFSLNDKLQEGFVAQVSGNDDAVSKLRRMANSLYETAQNHLDYAHKYENENQNKRHEREEQHHWGMHM